MAEAATIPQAGELEQKVSESKSPAKSMIEAAQDVEQKGIEFAKTVDGFFGDAVRTGTTSYCFVAGLPLLMAGPVGIVSLLVLMSTAYISSNLLYKIIVGSGKFSYSVFRNPIKRIRSITSGLSSIVMNPIANVKRVFTAPQKIYEALFEGGNHNKYGKYLGMILGGGFALDSLMPNFLTGSVGANRLEAVLGGAGKLASAATDRTLDAMIGAKEAIANYSLNAGMFDNPISSAVQGLGKKFDDAFVYGY